MRLDLYTLKLMLAVADTRNLTKAAEREAIAASALSKRISLLEQSLSIRIFERRHAGMFPTPAGEVLIGHARGLLRQVERIESEISDHSSGLRGSLRIFANTSAMVLYLPGDLRSFLNRHPLVQIEIEETTSQVTTRAVADGEADVGIYGDVVHAPHLLNRTYRHDALCLLVPEDHPLAVHESLRFAAALEHQFIGTPRGSSIDTAINDAADALDLPLKLQMRAAGFEAIGRMVSAGLGIAVVPEAIARSYSLVRNVRAITLAESWVNRRLIVCTRMGDTMSPVVEAFVEHLIGQKP